MSETAKTACRLFIILARASSVGVIFRRGPTKWVQLIKWNTDDDSFETGQWFHGRIYERRCDLSPNGSKLIYFASKINGRTFNDQGYTYAWTAISKPPWLTALALWPKGDCWHGGGLFEKDRTVWLNHRRGVAKPHPDHRPVNLKVIPNPQACGEDGPIYYRRLERDGWVHTQEGSYPLKSWQWITERPDIWEKSNRADKLRLGMTLAEINFKKPGGPYINKFSLVNEAIGKAIDIGRADWADWDQKGRLVLARDGKIYAGILDSPDYLSLREITDFNENKPELIESPDWAKRW